MIKPFFVIGIGILAFAPLYKRFRIANAHNGRGLRKYLYGCHPVNLTFNPNAWYPTLDILATLYDSTGTAITTSDLPGLHAGISTTLQIYTSRASRHLFCPAAPTKKTERLYAVLFF